MPVSSPFLSVDVTVTFARLAAPVSPACCLCVTVAITRVAAPDPKRPRPIGDPADSARLKASKSKGGEWATC